MDNDITNRELNVEAKIERAEDLKEALLDDADRLSMEMIYSDIPEWYGCEANSQSFADLCATIYRAHRVIERLTRGDSMEEIMRTMSIDHWRAFVRMADTIKANLDTILDEEVAEHLA